MIEIRRDGDNQPFIQWQYGERYKRAWIQKRTPDKDWAHTGRYLNVGPVNADGGLAGIPQDFPIFSQLSDEQILEAFVAAICAITGCQLTT